MTTQVTTPSETNKSTSPSVGAWFTRARPRIRDFFLHIIAQLRILKKAYPGIMHFLIFWGVMIQVVGTIINILNMALFLPWVITFPRGTAYLVYEVIMDLAGFAILLGVTMAFFRRIVLRPKTLETRWDDYYALILLTLIPILGFTMEATRLIATSSPWAAYSPFGNLSARILAGLGLTPIAATHLHDILFWVHAAVALLLVASIPFTKMRHLVNTPLNIIFRPLRKMGALEKIENIDQAEILGVGKVSEFTSEQLLSFDACLNCGRCEAACPSNISGMDYSPRSLVQILRKTMVDSLQKSNGKSSEELYAGPFSDFYTWQCTTCGACTLLCPAFINPVDEVVDMRRYQALTTGKLPKSISDTLRNFERQGNPWGIPAQDRMNWSAGLELRELSPGDETDVLYYVGCASAFDDRNKKVARSFISLLNKAGVNYGVLGLDETCCGETARRMGNEYLFQVFAEQNLEAMSKIKFNRIVTQCPHCFNTLKNEYPQFGSKYKVQHYTEFLTELSLFEQISPNGNGLKGRLTYHDFVLSRAIQSDLQGTQAAAS